MTSLLTTGLRLGCVKNACWAVDTELVMMMTMPGECINGVFCSALYCAVQLVGEERGSR